MFIDFLLDPTTGMIVVGYGVLVLFLEYPRLRRRYRSWCRREEWQRTPF